MGVVVIVDPGTVPINSRGEKQRMHLRDAFLHDQLDPIYVAYNMWFYYCIFSVYNFMHVVILWSIAFFVSVNVGNFFAKLFIFLYVQN